MKGQENSELRIAVYAPLGVGGVTTLMLNIQAGIDRSKLNFDYLVVHDRKEPKEDIAIEMGSRKLVASADQVRLRPLRGLARLFMLSKVCKDNKVKILHFNGGASMGVLILAAAKLGGVKYATFHSHNSGISNDGKLLKLISAICKPFLPLVANDLWACSTLAAQFSFPKSVVEKKHFYIMPNAVDLTKFAWNEEIRSQVRRELGISEKFVVGHAGRFNHQKNHMILIDIFKRIHEKESNSVLLLFGEGELFQKVKTYVHDKHLDEEVLFCGVSDEMGRMYQGMDVFLMPSCFEGFPVTGVEAQASGLPVVFSDVITREVAIGDNISYIPLSASVDVWADAVLGYKGCKRKDQCEKLRKAGFDQEKMIRHFQRYYLNVGSKLGLI